jgi:hypothetical protein
MASRSWVPDPVTVTPGPGKLPFAPTCQVCTVTPPRWCAIMLLSVLAMCPIGCLAGRYSNTQSIGKQVRGSATVVHASQCGAVAKYVYPAMPFAIFVPVAPQPLSTKATTPAIGFGTDVRKPATKPQSEVGPGLCSLWCLGAWDLASTASHMRGSTRFPLA